MDVIRQLESYFKRSSLAFMKAVPARSIVFDHRAEYMCKFGCKNYGRKYSCPPASTSVNGKIRNGKYKWAILFATTTRIPKLHTYLRLKALNNQKEFEIQRISVELNSLLNGNGTEHLVLSGGPCKACRECSQLSGLRCKKPQLRQTSMEAVGIDCQKTMHKAGFDFQMPNTDSINRCGCILIGEKGFHDIELTKRQSLQEFHQPTKRETARTLAQLSDEHTSLFGYIDILPVSKINRGESVCTSRCTHYGKNFACPPFSDAIEMGLWRYAILWKWKGSKYKKYRYNIALKRIHSVLFNLGHYFSLSLRDCHCDECVPCSYSMADGSICSFRKILSPSMQSQGIDPRVFGNGKFGMELI